MKLIGLTGGIGAGKSMVASIFGTLGIPVYESDARAKWLMNHDPALKQQIEELFGSSAYHNAQLNRGWIAEQVFVKKDLLQKLNQIVHPAVKQDALQWANAIEQAGAPYVLKESAILFEENLTEEMDGILLVVAPVQTRIQRVMERDGITQQQIEERMNHQWPDEQKIALADYVIYNDGERPLLEQIMDIDQMIRLR